jgi:hypothetical protein
VRIFCKETFEKHGERIGELGVNVNNGLVISNRHAPNDARHPQLTRPRPRREALLVLFSMGGI